MNKIKKLKLRSNVAFVLLFLMAVVCVGFGANAYQSVQAPDKVIENIEVYNEAMDVVEETLGAVTGPHQWGDLYVHGRFLQGGNILASSTSIATAVTLTASQLASYKQLDYTLTNVANAMTLPATTTLSVIQYPGECVNFKIRNLSTTAASSTTITAGTGIDLVENENGDVVIEGGNEAFLRFCRETDTDVTVSVDEYIAAD